MPFLVSFLLIDKFVHFCSRTILEYDFLYVFDPQLQLLRWAEYQLFYMIGLQLKLFLADHSHNAVINWNHVRMLFVNECWFLLFVENFVLKEKEPLIS